MKLRHLGFIGCCALFLLGKAAFALEVPQAFQEIKSEHFVVRFLTPQERNLARQTLERAEYFYDRIARDLGYARYDGYWTWERRAGIVIFPDQISFSRFTGQPAWSRGYATRESRFFQDKTIVSFAGQPNFFDEVLPHELAHLMIWDSFSNNLKGIPLWFEEGVAQLQETDKRDVVKAALRAPVEASNHIAFRTLQTLRPSELREDVQVGVFYAESLSIVLFLIEKYGQEAFYRLSKELRNGKPFEQALVVAYNGVFRSMEELETRWVKYILDQ